MTTRATNSRLLVGRNGARPSIACGLTTTRWLQAVATTTSGTDCATRLAWALRLRRGAPAELAPTPSRVLLDGPSAGSSITVDAGADDCILRRRLVLRASFPLERTRDLGGTIDRLRGEASVPRCACAESRPTG